MFCFEFLFAHTVERMNNEILAIVNGAFEKNFFNGLYRAREKQATQSSTPDQRASRSDRAVARSGMGMLRRAEWHVLHNISACRGAMDALMAG